MGFSGQWTRLHARANSYAFAFLAAMIFVVSGCGGGGSDEPSTAGAPFQITGSVGDGPVVNASVRVVDGNGEQIAEFYGDDQASYEYTVPQGTPLPVRVFASGGLDLVTERALDFELQAVSRGDADQIVNLSPLSTVTVRSIDCAGKKPSPKNLRRMWRNVSAELGSGLTAPDQLPMFEAVTAENAAQFVLTNEAVGEVVRRTARALALSGSPTDTEDVVGTIACDIASNGVIDTVGPDVERRVAATIKAAQASTLVELLAGKLSVDEGDAMARMDVAVAHIEPLAQGHIYAIDPTHEMLEKTLDTLVGLPSEDSADVVWTLHETPLEDVRSEMRGLLRAQWGLSISNLPVAIAGSDADDLDSVSERLRSQQDAVAPTISFTADDFTVNAGERTRLSWAAAGADTCIASGDWNGVRPTEGATTTPALRADAFFRLGCLGVGGAAFATLDIRVGDGGDASGSGGSGSGESDGGSVSGDAGGANDSGDSSGGSDGSDSGADNNGGGSGTDSGGTGVTVEFSASPRVVAEGASTELRWAAPDADRCVASGPAWSGEIPLTGSRSYGPVLEPVTLRVECTNANTTGVGIVQVGVQGALTLRWQAPSENTDGSPIESLDGYYIYVGANSGDYTVREFVDGGASTSASIPMPRGRYFVAMTSVAPGGVESGYSNEVVLDAR